MYFRRKMSRSGNAPVPNNQLVIFQPANWDVVYNGQNIERHSTTVEHAPQWLICLCQCLEKAEQHVHSLALAAANTDAMKIDVMELKTDYVAMSQVGAALFTELSRTIPTTMEETERHFKKIVQVCQVFRNNIWTTIYGLRNDQEGNRNTLAE
jgi:hypothetical protein